MKLNELPKLNKRSKKRIGQGLGSGKGKTGGKGTKGQNARGKVRLGFVGGGLPLYRKLPLVRGKGNHKMSEKLTVINLADLTNLKSGSIVDIETLVKNNIISARNGALGVKILGNGEIKIPLKVNLPVSESARKKIEGAGGKMVNE